MKPLLKTFVLVVLASEVWAASGASTINSSNRYAYGANIGWINFEAVGAPKVDLTTGRLQNS